MIACNLNAISEAELPHYKSLLAQLRDAVTARRELPDGYAFRINGESMSLVQVAQWISLERLCCPFLMFQLQTTAGGGDCWLTLQGPLEAKAILREAFTSTSCGLGKLD